MTTYLIRRLVRLILVWLGISLLTFLLLYATGDPARVVLGEMASDEAVAEYRRIHGLDRPWLVQYLSYLGGVLRGDLGRSFRYEQPIAGILIERAPATFQLAVASLFLSFAIGLPLGFLAVFKRDTLIDTLVRGLVLLAQGIPNFFLAILLVLLFAVQLHWLPTGGMGTPAHLVLPSLVLSFGLIPLTVRVTRSALLDVISQPYVRTAYSKGLARSHVLWRHVMRNAALPIITILGIQAATLLSGAIVTETIFSWPGIGRLIVAAILARDFPLVQSAVLVISTGVVLTNFAVDLLYGVLDPRITT